MYKYIYNTLYIVINVTNLINCIIVTRLVLFAVSLPQLKFKMFAWAKNFGFCFNYFLSEHTLYLFENFYSVFKLYLDSIHVLSLSLLPKMVLTRDISHDDYSSLLLKYSCSHLYSQFIREKLDWASCEASLGSLFHSEEKPKSF